MLVMESWCWRDGVSVGVLVSSFGSDMVGLGAGRSIWCDLGKVSARRLTMPFYLIMGWMCTSYELLLREPSTF